MIHIVTGRMNSGKTSTMLRFFEQRKQGDGILSIKRMHYDKVHGYDLLRLSDLSTRAFVMHEQYATNTNRAIACQIGPYLFYQDVLEDIEQQIVQSIKTGVSPIFLDEIGVLELQHHCFANMLEQVIKQEVEAYITVREDLIEDVIATFNITEYDIIHV